MGKQSLSLSRRVPWSKLSRELGIHVRIFGLPASTQCPLCSGVMRIMRDPSVSGEWFRCDGCRKQGDMIELAATVWDVDIPQTIARLSRLGYDLPTTGDGIQAYLHQHVDYRRRLSNLWDKAQIRLDNSRGLLRLSHHLGVATEMSESRLTDGAGQILRASDTATIERCFAPGSMKHADARRQNGNPSERAVFRGGRWDQVLVVPYYDLP